MVLYYQDEWATLLHGDALAILPTLADASVDAVVTDPPYSSGGMIRSDRMQDVHTKYVRTDSWAGNKLAPFTGDNRDQRGFAYWCALWLGESIRIVRPGGIAAMFTDWRQLPITTDALQSGGYVWRGIVPWYKPNARPTQGRWTNACEYVIWGTNGPRELAGNAFPGFFQANPPRERDHITEKPVEVMIGLLQVLPLGSVVLDPFAGSGTTLVAAKMTGRRSIGIELDEGCCEIAARRLAATTPPLPGLDAPEQLALDITL